MFSTKFSDQLWGPIPDSSVIAVYRRHRKQMVQTYKKPSVPSVRQQQLRRKVLLTFVSDQHEVHIGHLVAATYPPNEEKPGRFSKWFSLVFGNEDNYRMVDDSIARYAPLIIDAYLYAIKYYGVNPLSKFPQDLVDSCPWLEDLVMPSMVPLLFLPQALLPSDFQSYIDRITTAPPDMLYECEQLFLDVMYKVTAH